MYPTLETPRQAEDRKRQNVNLINGRDNAETSVGALAPATTSQVAKLDIRNGNTNPFSKAVKYAAKGRIALIGPAGSGKSYTSLLLARALAGPNGRIAAIDTEHGSLSKYADIFDFDVMELDSFSPRSFTEALHAAEAAGYDVFLCDSLSHFWVGRDGALEFVDMAAKRNKDNMGGWKEFRPHERAMVDEMVSSSCHVICTMRTKTDYQEQTDANGKKKRVKIGLAPVQRDGLEYEFDLVGYMDEDNTFITDKTRCSAYSQKAYAKPGPKEFAPFVEWLKGAAGSPRMRSTPQIEIGNNPMNSQASADYVAQQKIATGKLEPTRVFFWKTMNAADRDFQTMRERVGEVAYREELERYGWASFLHIRNALKAQDTLVTVKANVADCYWRMDDRAIKEGK
jgi:energy-coupling factor transporter ATP-binding protein EcfA2